jgi:hypothetical protein
MGMGFLFSLGEDDRARRKVEWLENCMDRVGENRIGLGGRPHAGGRAGGVWRGRRTVLRKWTETECDRAHLMEEEMWATFEDYEGSRVGRGKGDGKAVRGQ